MTTQRILVSLDALLDTRAGTLARMNKAALEAVIENGYWVRKSDNFEVLTGGLVTNDAFAQMYAKRDVETLKHSMLTALCYTLGAMTRTLQAHQTGKEEIGEIEVIVNTFPYRLAAEESEAIELALRPYVALSTKVSSRYLPLQQQTPNHLNESYDAYILYDFNEWDTIHRDELVKQSIGGFTMIFPELYLVGKELKDQDLQSKEGGELQPFRLVALALLEWVFIETHPVMMFSMLNPNHEFTKSS